MLTTHRFATSVKAAGTPDQPRPGVPSAGPNYAQVAPILQRNCISCHNPRGGAPFNLLTYQDAKQWGEQMLEVTQSRYMPPWLPAPDRGDFRGQRRLSNADLATIRGWVSAGMPEGPAAPAPPAPSAQSSSNWKLGQPDLTLQLASPVTLSGSGPDLFLNLIIPNTSAQRHAIRAMEIRASDPQAVRSIWLQVDAKGALRREHAVDWQAGIPGMEPPASSESLLASPAGLLFWTADAPVLAAEAHQSWTLEAGSDLVLTTHLKTTGHSETVQLTVALYYTKDAARARQPEVVELQQDGHIAIAPNEANTQVEGQFTLPAPASVQAVYPRAHFLGKELNAYATLPDGKKQWLVSIPKWDVDWQAVYRYSKPVVLPKSSTIHWQYVYDNSTDNPHNPNDPPEQVHAGNTSKDEVNQLWLELMPPASVTSDAGWRRQVRDAVQQQMITK